MKSDNIQNPTQDDKSIKTEKLKYTIYDPAFGTSESGDAIANQKIEIIYTLPSKKLPDRIKVMNLLTLTPIEETALTKFEFSFSALDDETASLSFKMPPFPIIIYNQYKIRDCFDVTVDTKDIEDSVYFAPKTFSAFKSDTNDYFYCSPFIFDKGKEFTPKLLLKDPLDVFAKVNGDIYYPISKEEKNGGVYLEYIFPTFIADKDLNFVFSKK